MILYWFPVILKGKMTQSLIEWRECKAVTRHAAFEEGHDQTVGKWVHQTRQNNTTHTQEFKDWNSLAFSPSSQLCNIHPELESLSSSLAHPVTHSTYILSPLSPPVCPPPNPFSIVWTSILLSLPWCLALHKEEAALPLPSSLVRTIHASSLAPVSLFLAGPDYIKLPG